MPALFAVPRSRFTWVGWLLLALVFTGGGFCLGWAAAILSTGK
jgi:hypothetical protein